MEPFIGQISSVGFAFAPKGWALCNGQLLPIASNQALFSIIGRTYGGDGITNFGLPDLRGRAAMHFNSNKMGVAAGVETVQLTLAQIPSHTHVPMAQSAIGTSVGLTNQVWAASSSGDLQYAPTNTLAAKLVPNALGPGGSDQPHDNMPPVLVLNYIIALVGIFPSHG
ncbi:MAG: tail fiber protein [Betaproteobacteria bacterium]